MSETPHDKLFKEAFGSVEAARGMLQRFVPALKRLETADGAALDRYTERVISAATLEEVFES